MTTRQLDLVLPEAARMTRSTDSAGSHEAAERLVESGAAEIQRARVLAAVQRSPGSTSKELEHDCGLDRAMIARRLPNLEDLGLVYAIAASEDPKRPRRVINPQIRKCRYSGTRCVRWYPNTFPKEAAAS